MDSFKDTGKNKLSSFKIQNTVYCIVEINSKVHNENQSAEIRGLDARINYRTTTICQI